ncbi:unnamed protein product [Lactuca saligna]|uniref:Coiled-coil domain-containing protein SCD2 n=1 Tax=Lactuca saligna TaxID=75948 RepID=A0AA36E616_LACSI|nr:unnamed protein product [Lactuca saligna]
MDRGIDSKSVTPGGGSDDQLSPPMASSRGAASPTIHRHSRSGSIVKRSQNTKEAAQRLAQMMSHQQTDDSEDDEDLLSDFSPPATTSSSSAPATGRSQIRHRSPMTVHTTSAPRIGRSSQPVINNEQFQSQSARSSSDQTSNSLRSAPSITTVEHVQPNSARANRSPQRCLPMEQPSSARAISAGRPSLVMKPVAMVPPSVNLSLRPTSGRDTQPDAQKNKRFSLDLGVFARESSNQRSATATASAPTSATASTSALEDDIDMLQEENESLIEKLRIAEERYEEAEMRARQLEKQVAHLGEGVSLEAKLLSRKEASLQQREAAFKAAIEENGGVNIGIRGGAMEALRVEAETARDEATSIMEQLHETESEVKSLKTMFQRMLLTQEEVEELVLKRCWLSWYWSLCVQHGIHAEIAGTRYEYWSSFAPLPVEVVVAAGQMAKDEKLMEKSDEEEREKVLKDAREISGEGSVESMLLVERGLRELSLLKIEDAVALAMAHQRRPTMLKSGLTELSKEEADDVRFKQGWLIYFWRRVKIHGLEVDIVDERLQFWINQSHHPPTSHDAVEVERGLIELRKLGIEAQLWQASRKLVDPDSQHKWQLHINF